MGRFGGPTSGGRRGADTSPGAAVWAVEVAKSTQWRNGVTGTFLAPFLEPGIDGLETFARVTAVRPEQRAIIVSGFAETERVQKAQELGAGLFLKKPYVIEKFAAAVRRELDRP